MRVDVSILFCDDELAKHEDFTALVELPVLKQLEEAQEEAARSGTRFPDYSISFYHSQSYDGPNNLTRVSCRANNVSGWIQEGKRFDIVVTDLDFGGGRYGGHAEGIQVIKRLAQS